MTRIVVALTRTELQPDPDVLEVIGVEVSMLLDECGFNGDATPLVPVSAHAALQDIETGADTLRSLLRATDRTFTRR